ncbi:hypothetical protein QJL30_10600 [Clostridioides difficile]|uniref:Uncharacterized protein n=2 Tax=Clostridioides TaxID=1870884 RepID=A0A386JC16_CLODI|nr:hypothetical protein [Clostridioides difficile]EQF29813.1 hypothetical protein QEW_4586 [Clostridioides difficile CD160]AYD68732.1 hypothetical protein pHSJD-312_00111 [Clostridioides difficile]MDI2882225.1 hypothetical protein [Clostridioides difficile]MDI3004391.1 hypothetical protein [Clostridioides difficile]MDN9956154.1 hypothetical protein [Clostridioides difficile]
MENLLFQKEKRKQRNTFLESYIGQKIMCIERHLREVLNNESGMDENVSKAIWVVIAVFLGGLMLAWATGALQDVILPKAQSTIVNMFG